MFLGFGIPGFSRVVIWGFRIPGFRIFGVWDSLV